jgi:glycine oxidase
VLIVGGGIIGLAIACRTAETGLSVRVIDSSGTRGASWAAAGMLAPISEASFGEEELTRLNVAAVAEFVQFAALLEDRTGSRVGLRTDGTLAVAFNADDRVALDRLTEFRTSLGLKTKSLTGREARRLEPFLAADVRSGVLALDDLSVDNRQYATALRTVCDTLAVGFIIDDVAGLISSGGRVTGVQTTSGRSFSATTVVLCAGAATGQLTDLPVQPVKGQILRLAVPDRLSASGPVLSHTVRGIVRGSEVYLVPREHGEVVVGATSEQQGNDTTVTAGGVYELLRNAYELLPISSEFRFCEARAGLRPGTPDNAPIVGQLSAGLIVASGHYRNGILLSASTATAVTRLIAGQAIAEEWKPFSPERFAKSGRQ